MRKEELGLEQIYEKIKRSLSNKIASSEDSRHEMIMILIDEQIKLKCELKRLSNFVNTVAFMSAAVAFCVAVIGFCR